MHYQSLPNRLFRWAAMATLGEVYPEIRAIAVGFTKEKEFTLRYYLDREPIEYDRESISEIMTYIVSHRKADEYITAIKEELVHSIVHQGDLDPLSGFIYGRKE